MRKTENTRVHVPAHEVSEGFVPSQDFHVERCRRRGPRSLRALMRRVMHRFTPSAGAPGKSGAVLLAGTPADVLNSAPWLPCSREIPFAPPSGKSIANSNGSLRRLRESEIVVVH